MPFRKSVPIADSALLDMIRGQLVERCIEATGGNDNPLGAIIYAIFGRTPPKPPGLGTGAVIDQAGVIHCDMVDKEGYFHPAVPIFTTEQFVINLRGLADHMKLSDLDRERLFHEARLWIKKDMRAKSEET